MTTFTISIPNIVMFILCIIISIETLLRITAAYYRWKYFNREERRYDIREREEREEVVLNTFDD